MVSTAEVADNSLGEAVRLLVEALHPVRIYLFGSRARGEETAESDYDVLVLVEQKGGKPYQIEQRAYRAIAGVMIPIEIVVMSRQHFERRREVRASLPATVEREGKLLYAA
jgi:predicted nucleotidyltransferase